MKKNEGGQVVAFQAVSSTDGSAVTTGSPTVYVTIDGGTQASGANTAIHEGQGAWSYVPTQAETDGDHVVYTFTLAGCINQSVNVYPVVVSEYQATGFSTFDHTTDEVTTDSASRTASQADVSGLATQASVDAVDSIVDAILLDTADLQANQGNWLTATGFNTVAPDNAGIAANGLAIANLNDFDPATDTVLVGDKTGFSLSTAANEAIGTSFLAHVLTKGNAGTIERTFWQLAKTQTLADGEVSGTPTTSAFDTNLTAVTGAYDHLLAVFVSGALNGEARPIDSYSSVNGRITLQEPLTATPSATDEFIIVPDHNHAVSDIAIGVRNLILAGDQSPITMAGNKVSNVILVDTTTDLTNQSGGGGGDATLANQTAIISTLGDMSGATFDTSTDSLEAIRNRGDAAWVTGGGGGGIWQLTVTVTDTSANAVQGARVAVDGTSLTVTTDTSGEAVLNLNDGGYTLNISAPSGYDDPSPQSVTISGADATLNVVISPTSGSGSCEIPPL